MGARMSLSLPLGVLSTPERGSLPLTAPGTGEALAVGRRPVRCLRPGPSSRLRSLFLGSRPPPNPSSSSLARSPAHLLRHRRGPPHPAPPVLLFSLAVLVAVGLSLLVLLRPPRGAALTRTRGNSRGNFHGG
jgi:hypothetical protein